jgi:hypothetical protein
MAPRHLRRLWRLGTDENARQHFRLHRIAASVPVIPA